MAIPATAPIATPAIATPDNELELGAGECLLPDVEFTIAELEGELVRGEPVVGDLVEEDVEAVASEILLNS